MITIKILSQPSDTTCGPTSLHAVYNYYGDNISLGQIIREVPSLDGGGTLGVLLGNHALQRGYRVKIYTYNLNMFDPTWFRSNETNLVRKLQLQAKYKRSRKFLNESNAYIKFLRSGGEVYFKDIAASVLKKYLNKEIPVLTGLSATYLYNHSREFSVSKNKSLYDNIRGYPTGHFVILAGYDRKNKVVLVADPYKGNPFSENQYYKIGISRLINSILLGIVTFDANLLIIQPK